ncbi:VOC family protein [Nocardia brasiliensis]|uniref:VOC family protein n=1 Tax=Nocardia brasiliensis TaxID=37326 RepID=UPI003D90091B
MGLSIDRIDHVVINCRDVAATARWYVDVLGMRAETFGPSERTALRFGDQKLNLRPVGALGADPTWTTAAVESAGAQDLCFVTTASADEVHDHLVACGVGIMSGPVRKTGALGEMISHYCRDPDGNLIEIAVYPSV